MREIKINDCLNGFIVTIGCATVVFESKGAMIAELIAYLDDPYVVEQRYLEKARPPTVVTPLGPSKSDCDTQPPAEYYPGQSLPGRSR